MNVVTLLPSATEIVYALGVEPVGVSHECDYPPAARKRSTVNYSRIDADVSSREINERVAAVERDHGGVYGIHEGLLANLEPDVIVTQGLCDVCAVDTILVKEVVDRIDAEPDIVTVDPHSLSDVLEDIDRLGRVLDREQQAAELAEELRSRVHAVENTAARTDQKPTVVVLDWLDPPMIAGHWVPELVELAGGRYEMEEPGGQSRPREWDDIRSGDPEVLVAAPCGFDLDQTRSNVNELRSRQGWADLRAVREGRVYALDGHNYVNRPGPRLVDTLEHLAGLLHPDLFARPPADVAQPLSELVRV